MDQALQKRQGGMAYSSGGQQIQLCPQDVRQYLVSGRASVTDSEVMLFMALCKANQLNPWLRDAYLIKYSDKQPASMVVSKYAYAKRAEHHPHYKGFKAGIVVLGAEGQFVYREGSIVTGSEELIGGWADVFRDDREHPVRSEVALHEYIGMRPIWENKQKVGEEPTEMWAKKKATMIRKVALVQAWRDAFPEEYAGIYSEEEMPPHDMPVERKTETQKVESILGVEAKHLHPAVKQQQLVVDADGEPQTVTRQGTPDPDTSSDSVVLETVQQAKPAKKQGTKKAKPAASASPDVMTQARKRFGDKHVDAVHGALRLPVFATSLNELDLDVRATADHAWQQALSYKADPPDVGTPDFEAYIETLKAGD